MRKEPHYENFLPEIRVHPAPQQGCGMNADFKIDKYYEPV